MITQYCKLNFSQIKKKKRLNCRFSKERLQLNLIKNKMLSPNKTADMLFFFSLRLMLLNPYSIIKLCYIFTFLFASFAPGKVLLDNNFQLSYLRCDRSWLCSPPNFVFLHSRWVVHVSLPLPFTLPLPLSLIVKFTASVSLWVLWEPGIVRNSIPEYTQLSSHQRLLGGSVVSFHKMCESVKG